jgi:hypothetical protein
MQPIGTWIRSVARLVALLLAGLGFAGSAGATSANTDLSDIWWTPTESGWGVQFVNTGLFVFATTFVYGPDGKPTWVTGELHKTNNSADAPTFSGPVYVNTGPWFGGAFNPANVDSRQAGTMSFSFLEPPYVGRLTFSVDGVVVTRDVFRQTLTMDDYTGSYAAFLTATATECTNPAGNVSVTSAVGVQIFHYGDQIGIAVTNPNNVTCTTTGTYRQYGRLGLVNGTYSCTNGDSGEAIYLEMSNQVKQISTRFVFHSALTKCASRGRIAGLVPD